MTNGVVPQTRLFHQTHHGMVYLGDSLQVLPNHVPEQSVDLIMTSPPFGLVRKKDYGNADADEYLDWFRPFGEAFKRVLKPTGSLVIDIGGSWIPGQPTRSLYHFKLLIMLVEEFGFHLAQEFYWWSPSRLPTPAEWVTVRRIRVKDAVNCVWWMSLTPWPRADNKRVLQPYSDSMEELLVKGYKAKKRPSGHDISTKFSTDNGAAIPPNLLAMPNTDSNGYYLRYCREHGYPEHPARFPAELPEFFIRMLTDEGDSVLDPFAGSCVTGEVCERLKRHWTCVELDENYLKGALGRFLPRIVTYKNGNGTKLPTKQVVRKNGRDTRGGKYTIWNPGAMWDNFDDIPLAEDGGQKRRITKPKPRIPEGMLLDEEAESTKKYMNTTQNRHMPAELAAVFSSLDNDIIWIHVKLQIYRQLFTVDQERVNLLNTTAKSFFVTVEDTLINIIILSISRLVDPLKTKGKDNMVLGQLVEKLASTDPKQIKFRESVSKDVDDIRSFCEPLRQLRNCSIAHRDFQTAIHNPITPLPPVNLNMIEGALKMIRDLMNKVQGYFDDIETYYEPVMQGDADSLVFYLKEADESIKNRRRACR